MDILASLPESSLQDIGIEMDTSIVHREAHRPVGGRLAHFLPNWERISSDKWILGAVTGYKLELTATPHQTHKPVTHMERDKEEAMSRQVKELQDKGAIVPVPDSEEGFVSLVFLVPKSDGSWRTMINLRALNRFVAAPHFKMESVRTAKGIIQRGDWMAKLDLKDAYLAVPIDSQHQKFLKFRWNSQTWQFRALPFGLNSSPQVFTKLLKPVVAVLRKLGIRLILYMDDMLVLASTKEEGRR